MNSAATELRGPRPKKVRVRTEPHGTNDGIVWAAYRKFGRGGGIREALRLCIEEERAGLKDGRSLP
jgi:hypothetical protein